MNLPIYFYSQLNPQVRAVWPRGRFHKSEDFFSVVGFWIYQIDFSYLNPLCKYTEYLYPFHKIKNGSFLNGSFEMDQLLFNSSLLNSYLNMNFNKNWEKLLIRYNFLGFLDVSNVFEYVSETSALEVYFYTRDRFPLPDFVRRTNRWPKF